MVGMGALSAEDDASPRASPGPLLRATGVPYDVRRASPTGSTIASSSRCRSARTATTSTATSCAWPRWSSPCASSSRRSSACPAAPINVDFEGREIPVDAYVDLGKQGKTEGLLLLPITLSPNLQGQGRAAQARVNVDDKTVVMPPKETAYGSIEGLMNHFMLVMDGYGIRPPAGEAYFAVEGANGELGFYVVSDGGDRPYRVRCRPPCLPPVAALPRMIEGQMVADIIPTFGSVNMIGGELDR